MQAGDDVSRKKPDPLIYNLAAERLGLSPDRCIVIEDSMVGLRAAMGAGMHCIITPTSSTESAPFCEEGASAVLSCLRYMGVDDLFVKDDEGRWMPGFLSLSFRFMKDADSYLGA